MQSALKLTFKPSRGKKIFRRFDEVPTTSADGSLHADEQSEIRRLAGIPATRPFTRSSIKPRKLFDPVEEELPTDADEEAITDIEEQHRMKVAPHTHATTTPVKRSFRPTTPPTTARKTRTSKATPPTSSSPEHPSAYGLDGTEESSSTSRHRLNPSPFDSWQRTKPASSRSISGKRSAEPMEKAETKAGKRTKGAETI